MSDPLDRAKALLEAGRLEEALAITGPLADSREPTHQALALHSTVLKGLGRREQALSFDQRAVMRFPGSGVAWHNLAATLGDLGRGAESVAALERGFALGLDGALSWGTPARAGGGRPDGRAGYGEVRRRAARAGGDRIRRPGLDAARRPGGRPGGAGSLAHAGGRRRCCSAAPLFEAAGRPSRAPTSWGWRPGGCRTSRRC